MTSPARGDSQSETYDKRGFWALITTQFQGAFNDNLYKLIIVYFLLALYAERGPEYLIWGHFMPDRFVPAFATLLFSVPFILFPALFGSLADRFSKQKVALATKYWEIGVMALGGLAFMLAWPPFIWFVLFLMLTQSAMFSPAKYGILPETLPESRLSAANGLLQLFTIVAVIAGTGMAGLLYELFKEQVYWVSGVLVMFSIAGTVTAHFMARPPAANPEQPIHWNLLKPWAGTGPYFGEIWRSRVLLNVVIGYTYFWFAGALMQQALLVYTQTTLSYGANQTLNSGVLGALAMGIGLGALAAGYLSRGKIETGLIPLSALGMAFFCLLLAIPHEWYNAWLLHPMFGSALAGIEIPNGALYYGLLLFVTFGIGFFAGGFDVPLAAKVQQLAPNDMKGGIIAATNVLTFVGVAASSLVFLIFGAMNLTPNHIFLAAAILSALVGVYISFRLPILLLRAGLWLLDGTVFRLRVLGRQNLPEHGPALLVGNHGSFIECLVLLSAIDREVHFVMREDVYQKRVIRPLAKLMHIIPVPSRASEADLLAVEGRMREALESGALVCINREKYIEPDGLPLPWFEDYRRITNGLDAPIIPLAQTRMWEVLFDYDEGKFIWHRLGWIRFPLFVWIGEAVGRELDGRHVRHAQRELEAEVHQSKPYMFTQLHRAHIKTTRRNLFRRAMVDSIAGELSHFKVLVGTLIFARKLAPMLHGQEMVGLLLPSTVGGALANLALTMLGKTTVNLNYTASSALIRSCAGRCNITHVITAKAFLERVPVEVPGEAIYLEDVRASVTGKDKILAMLLALFAPIRLIERLLGTLKKGENDLATIIFSSGSEGDPKGIMLTHRNILSQVETTSQDFPHDRGTCMVGFLPFFHSFGYTATIWLPILCPLGVLFYPSPLEPKIIGGLIQQHGGTHLVGTATFLQGFIRRCTPEQLASLQFVVAGAEKLPERIRFAFRDKFGAEPMEGYGTTELSPIVSINHPDRVSPGFFLPGVRHGTIGRLIPGQNVCTTDPETGEFLPLGKPGLLNIKGPNIMRGYLHDPERTAKVIKDGWYCTGDMGVVSDDGFVTITGRLARFSKIGGEMVPHGRLEEVFHGMLGLTEQALAVAGVPDLAKGERLVVLHILEEAQTHELLEKIEHSDLPHLWRPRRSAFHRIEALPVLGSGKLDLKKVKDIAMEFDAGH